MVLVVDDDADLRQTTADLLALVSEGAVKSNGVGTLADGIREAGKGGYDAVLLDLGLPDAKELEAINAFQDSHPELPIVVLSGRADPELATRCIHAGAVDFIAKGNGSDLLDRIDVAVIRHKVRKKYEPLQAATDALKETLGKMAQVAEAGDEIGRSGAHKVVKP